MTMAQKIMIRLSSLVTTHRLYQQFLFFFTHAQDFLSVSTMSTATGP